MGHWKSNGSRLYHIPRVGRPAARADLSTAPRYNPQLMSSAAPERVASPLALAMALAGCPDVVVLDRSPAVLYPEAR
jgi:hypothetical protein